jgi:hypothetical protein
VRVNAKLQSNETSDDKPAEIRTKTSLDQRSGDILEAIKLRNECNTFLGELKLAGVPVWGDHALWSDGAQCFVQVKLEPFVPLKLAKRGDEWGVLILQQDDRIIEEWFENKEDMMEFVSEVIRRKEAWMGEWGR